MNERVSDNFYKPLVPDSIRVYPSRELKGKLTIPGDKVTAVHLLLAAAVVGTESRINNTNYCGDVLDLVDWMRLVNLAKIDLRRGFLDVRPEENSNSFDLSGLANTRSNICLVSALALKHGKVCFKGTRGCSFTDRKVDKHFILMESLGLSVEQKGDTYEITRPKLSDSVNFDCSTEKYGPSVGVTCHALLASLVYPNRMVLRNVALEAAPMTLVEYVKNSTNRKIDIRGRTIVVEAAGQIDYKDNSMFLPPDITIASTYVSALVSAGKGSVELEGVLIKEIPFSVLEAYSEMGVEISENPPEKLTVEISEKGIQIPKKITCEVMPGFPTDIGPILSASIAGARGKGVIEDVVYDSRSSHVEGLNKMGYNLEAERNKVTVNGRIPEKMGEVNVEAKDIRAGAALVIGAIGSNADCVTISHYDQIYRGYANLVNDLQTLGVKIENIKNGK